MINDVFYELRMARFIHEHIFFKRSVIMAIDSTIRQCIK